MSLCDGVNGCTVSTEPSCGYVMCPSTPESKQVKFRLRGLTSEAPTLLRIQRLMHQRSDHCGEITGGGSGNGVKVSRRFACWGFLKCCASGVTVRRPRPPRNVVFHVTSARRSPAEPGPRRLPKAARLRVKMLPLGNVDTGLKTLQVHACSGYGMGTNENWVRAG